MHVSFVVAMDRNRVIGLNQGLPWHLPRDLRRFEALTLGKVVLMGRRTHEAIGRPLPGRRNLVLTRAPGYATPGCEVVHSLEEALARAAESGELMVIGGAEIFRQLLSRATRLYLTEIDAAVDGDTWFPDLDRSEWREVEREDVPADERNPYPLSFVTLERVPGPRQPGGREPSGSR